MIIETEEQAKAFVAERCTATAFAKLDEFVAELRIEAENQNLISRTTMDSVWQRHVADSAQLLDHVPRETSEPWLDIGTGAGFPGIVTAVMRPDLAHVLCEPRAKRVIWLQRMVGMAQLDNCRVEGSRVEKIETFAAGVISARACASLKDLVSLSARFSTDRTHWVLPKGRSAAQERDELNSQQRAMFHVEQSLTSRDAAILVGTGRPKGGSRQ